MRWFPSRRETRQIVRLEDLALEGIPTWSGETVGPDSALRLGAVWACVRLLSETVATMPLDVFGTGSREQVDTPALLRAPAAGLSLHDWTGQVMTSLLLRGNAYGLVTARSGTTLLPSQVEILSPDVVTVTRLPDGRISYRVGGREVDRADVWHVRGMQTPGAIVGLSPIEYAKQAVGLGLAVEKFGATFFGDGCQPTGYLKTSQQMAETEAKTLQASWVATRRRNREPAVLTGDLTYAQVAIAPEESQFVESRRLSVAEIARVFGVPPELIAGESGGSLTYANVEQRGLDFVTYSLSPWLSRLEAAISTLLPSTQYVKFNAGSLVRADLETRYKAHEIGLRAGFLTLDEVRALEDRPPLTVAPIGDTGGIA